MVSGERRSWVERFRVTDRKFLHCVARIWRQSIARLPPSSCEDTITVALVEALSKDAEARGWFYCEYQFYPFARSSLGPLTGTSRVDIAVIVGHDRAAYLAYECKRLNVAGADGAKRSQARAYVGKDGMMRFVTEKYAEGLPIGCMMGYVMDGDLNFAFLHIKATMTAEQPALGLQGELQEDPPIGIIRRFVTEHERDGRWMEIRHALLPFVQASP